MNRWHTLKYPIRYEAQLIAGGPWTLVHEVQTPEEMEFGTSQYKFSTQVHAYRFVTADGNIQEVNIQELIDFQEQVEATGTRSLAPLEAFANHAPAKAMETATELIQGGLAAKQFVIPARARVMLHHPNLHHLYLAEFQETVICRIHVSDAPPTDTEPTVTIYKNPVNFGTVPEDLPPTIQSFLCLLCASVVRDFWVMESRARQRTYQTRTEKQRRREGRGKDRKLVVEKDYIFIPRFQYDLSVYQDKPQTEIQHEVRVTLSPHLVSGHIRNLPENWKASEEAKENAAEFGIHLQEGQTFVRPHERGEVEQLRTYRSRSAVELLFGTQ